MSTANITYRGVSLVVEYDYTPEEPAEHYGDAPYPGCPEQVDIGEVLVGKVDISSLLDIDVIHELESEVLEYREGARQAAEEDRAEERYWDRRAA